MSVIIADHFFLFAEEYGRYTVAGAAKDPIIFLRSSACASVTGYYKRRSELTTEQVNHQIGPLVAKTGIRSTPIDAASGVPIGSILLLKRLGGPGLDPAGCERVVGRICRGEDQEGCDWEFNPEAFDRVRIEELAKVISSGAGAI